MGGNALNFKTRRVNRAEQNAIAQQVMTLLQYEGMMCVKSLEFSEKNDFGDLDLIVTRKPSYFSCRWISENFGSKHVSKNDNVYSFDYNNFQIDLIFCDEKNFDVCQFYYSYNDLNNFAGRIAACLGFRFGFYGLHLHIHHDLDLLVTKKVLISKDPRQIYEMLDLNYDRYLQGFSTMEDVFGFIKTSKHFYRESFDLSKQNHDNRSKNKARKNYLKFLDWMDQNCQDKPFKMPKRKTLDEKIHFLSNFIDVGFIQSAIKVSKLEEQNRIELTKKFNGKLVMDLTGLKGIELGSFIGRFKRAFSDEELLYMDQEEIKQKVLKMFNS